MRKWQRDFLSKQKWRTTFWKLFLTFIHFSCIIVRMKFFLLVVFAIMLVVGNVGSALAGIQSSHLEVFSQLSKNDSLILFSCQPMMLSFGTFLLRSFPSWSLPILYSIRYWELVSKCNNSATSGFWSPWRMISLGLGEEQALVFLIKCYPLSDINYINAWNIVLF